MMTYEEAKAEVFRVADVPAPGAVFVYNDVTTHSKRGKTVIPIGRFEIDDVAGGWVIGWEYRDGQRKPIEFKMPLRMWADGVRSGRLVINLAFRKPRKKKRKRRDVR